MFSKRIQFQWVRAIPPQSEWIRAISHQSEWIRAISPQFELIRVRFDLNRIFNPNESEVGMIQIYFDRFFIKRDTESFSVWFGMTRNRYDSLEMNFYPLLRKGYKTYFGLFQKECEWFGNWFRNMFNSLGLDSNPKLSIGKVINLMIINEIKWSFCWKRKKMH